MLLCRLVITAAVGCVHVVHGKYTLSSGVFKDIPSLIIEKENNYVHTG